MNLLYGIGNIKHSANVADFSAYISKDGGLFSELAGETFSFGNASFNSNFPLCIASSEDYAVTCDCLITNKEVLAVELGLDTDINDADLILAAFTKWGEDIVCHLDGDFAIAVSSVNSSDLWLFRDHMGVKPLYYSITKDGVYFASNYFLMVDSGFVEGEITKESLAFFVEEPIGKEYYRTTFANISRVLPAGYIHFKVNEKEETVKYKEVKYWNPLKNIRINKKRNLRQTVRDLEKVLVEAVKKRGEEKNVAVHLSGGIDSSTVAGVLGSIKNEEIKAYSWSPEPMGNENYPEKDSIGSEYRLIDSCCKKYTYDLKYIDYTPKDLLNYLTSPDCMFVEWVEIFVINRMKEDNVDRLLSGWGGDEFFSLRHRVIWYEYFMHPYGLFRLFYCLNKNFKATLGKLYSTLIYALVPRPIKIFKIRKIKSKDCFIKDKKTAKRINKYQYSYIYRYFKNTKNKLAQKKLDLCFLSDRNERWNAYAYTKGIEYGFPLLDKNVIEFMFSIPVKYFTSLKYNRVIARLTARNFIPDMIKKNNVKTESGRMEYLMYCYDEIYHDVIDKLKEAKECELLSYIDIDKLIERLYVDDGIEKYPNIVKGLQILLLYNFAKKYGEKTCVKDVVGV